HTHSHTHTHTHTQIHTHSHTHAYTFTHIYIHIHTHTHTFTHTHTHTHRHTERYTSYISLRTHTNNNGCQEPVSVSERPSYFLTEYFSSDCLRICLWWQFYEV